MRKILVGLIAAMMLFAFTACDPGTMTVVQETGNPLVSKATLKTTETYYEGDIIAQDTPVSVDLVYVNGNTASVVVPVAEAKTLTGGDNALKVTLPQEQGECFVVVSAVALNDTLTVVLPEGYKTTYTADEYTAWTPDSTDPADVESVGLYYADGTLKTEFTKGASASATEYTIAWNSATKSEIDSIVVTAGASSEYKYEIPLTITKPATTVAKWQIQVNGEAGNAVDVEWGDSRTAATSQITVVELDSADNVIGTVASNRYEIIGLPANFNEYSDAPTNETPVLSYTVTLVATNATDVKYVDTASQANEITITVEDPIDWTTLKFEWADSAADKFVVDGSVDTTDIEITALETASGADKSGDASVSAIAGNNFTGKTAGSQVWVNFIVSCDDIESAQQRIQTEKLVASN